MPAQTGFAIPGQGANVASGNWSASPSRTIATFRSTREASSSRALLQAPIA